MNLIELISNLFSRPKQQFISPLAEDQSVAVNSVPKPSAKPYPVNLASVPQGYKPYQPQVDIKDIPRDVNSLKQIIESGLRARGNPPIATVSGDFADAGSRLPSNINPLLPVILSLMETGGGKYIPPNSQNDYNTLNIYSPSRGGWARFRNHRASLFGNNPDETVSLLGLLKQGGLYDDFLNSGNVADLFKKYTPESDPSNPRNYELVDRYNMISDSLLGKIEP